MVVKLISKWGDVLKEYYSSINTDIPMVDDTVVVAGEKYKVVNRTFDVDTYSAIVEVWKVVEDNNGLV